METRGNRLCLQSMGATTTSTPQNVPTQTPRVTLRRRCRSECMPPMMGTTSLNGSPTNPKHFNDLNELRRKAYAVQPPPQTMPVSSHGNSPQHRQANQSMSPKNVMSKYSPASVLRNQDISKNIFSFVDIRRNGHHHNGGVGGGSTNNGGNYKVVKTKENFLSSPTHHHNNHSGPLQQHKNKDDFSAASLSAAAADIHYGGERLLRSVAMDYRQQPAAVADDRATAPKLDSGRRRVRARSESEPHELYQSKHLLATDDGKGDRCQQDCDVSLSVGDYFFE